MTPALDICCAPDMPDVRLDVFIAQALLEHSGEGAPSRSRVQQLIEEGAAQVDGAKVRPSWRLQPGQRVTVSLPPAVPLALTPVPMALDIVFEDEHLVVLNKPAHLPVHPGAGVHRPTLVHGLLAHCEGWSGIGGVQRPGIVHRLDADTTGLIVVAKHDRAHQHIAAQFAARTVRKIYLALVHGRPQAAGGTIDTPFGRHPRLRQRMTGRLPEAPGGRRAVTHWRLVASAGGRSLLEVALETGRTHQIRAHLAELGLPIVGDSIYGKSRSQSCRGAERDLPALDHQALHAQRLALRHPIDGRQLVLEAPVPESWARAYAQLRACAPAAPVAGA